MKIAAIDVFPVSIPLRIPLRMAIATVRERPCVIVRIRSDNGVTGLGESVTAPYFTGETLASAAEVIRNHFAPALIGRDPTELHNLRNLMATLAFANQAAKAAVEMALHDLVARSLGTPLFQLYGGRTRAAVPTIWHVSGSDPRALAEDAAEAVETGGFSIVKVKVGGDVRTDIEKVFAVRSAVGDEVMLLPDANQGWEIAEAKRFCDAIVDAGVGFLEQPVVAGDVLGMAEVNRGPVTIAADEGVFDARALRLHIEVGAVGAVSVKLMKAAGPIGALAMFAVADTSGIGAHLAGMPGQTSIGALHAAHVATAVSNLQYGAGICPYYLEGDVVAEPFEARHGNLVVPDGPGLGTDLDETALARFTVEP